MLASISEGLLLGLVLSVLTGPIFFTILQVSIEKGGTAGVALVAGQWLSDFIYIGLAFYAATYMQQLQEDPLLKAQVELYLGSIGSVFLALLGLLLLLSKAAVEEHNDALKTKSLLGYFFQGFLINSLTPFPIFFWISLMGSAIGRGMNIAEALVLGLSVMVMVVLTDLLKVYLARRIRRLLTPSKIRWVRKIAGLALILSGILLFVRIIF